jgi:Ala-tRNA(Pro) deacylase
MKVEEFLRSRKIPYTRRHHPEAFTAQEVAAVSHVPGGRMLKAVVVRVAEAYAIAVCPACSRIDTDLLSKLTGQPVRLANEGEMEAVFKDAELGAEAPIGGLYGLSTYADTSLSENKQVVFQAGSHTDVIELSYADFVKAATPVTGRFAEHL